VSAVERAVSEAASESDDGILEGEAGLLSGVFPTLFRNLFSKNAAARSTRAARRLHVEDAEDPEDDDARGSC